jgi:hypothetical protein
VNVTVRLDSAHVLDDDCIDYLTGGAGQDLLFFNQAGDGGAADKVTDLGAQEFAEDINFINNEA